MATKNIVPRGNNEGQLGTDEKRWNSVIAETASFTTFSGSITGNEFTLFSGSAQSTASFGFLMGDGRGLTNLTATATPGGSDNHVQFNDGGTTGGDAGFQYNKTTNSITHITNITASGHISSSATSTGSFGLILGDGSQLTNLPASFTSAGISGSFTPTSSSLASRVSNIVDGTTIVASASNAITASHALNSGVTSYTSLTNVPTDIVSGSAQLATSISGSFTSTSSSIATEINTFRDGTATLISGSLTSTGSFGRLEVAREANIGAQLTVQGSGTNMIAGDLGVGATATSQVNLSSVTRALTIMGSGATILELASGGTRRANFFSDGTDASLTNNSTGKLEFLTDNNYRLSILADGKVGIGTRSPGVALEVVGSVSGSSTSTGSFGNLRVNGNGSVRAGDGGTTYGSLYAEGGSGDVELILNAIGGASPDINFQVAGTAKAAIISLAGSDDLRFRTNGNSTDQLIIDSSGHSTFTGNVVANGNIVGDNSTNISQVNDITVLGNISGSITSTGSFGRIEVSADTLAIGGTELNKTVADNITDLDQELNTTSSPVFSGLRVAGDITAERYIVSSSVTFMTQSFSSGSTIFGDTSSDTHKFTGSLQISGGLEVQNGNISGSSTSTGSFGELQSTTATIPNLQGNVALSPTNVAPVSIGSDARWITLDGTNYSGGTAYTLNGTQKAAHYWDTSGHLRHQGIANDTGHKFSVRDGSGNYLHHLFESDGNIEIAGNISGSSTSTGSFGHLKLGNADTDAIFEFGRAHIGHIGFSDMAGFSHVDHDGTGTFALAQNSSGKTIVQAASGQPIAFKIGGTDRVQINSSGDLGVGIETAQHKLHVVGDGFFTGNVSGSATSTGSFGSIIAGSDAGGFQQNQFFSPIRMKTDGTANAPAIVINQGGNGFYKYASNEIGISANGVATAVIRQAGLELLSGAYVSGSATSTGSFGQVTTTTPGRIIGNITEIIEVTVVDDGGNHYAFEGATTPNLVVSEGKTYRFDQSDSTNDSHPFAFSLTEDGSTYTTGVTTVGTPGVTGAYTEIKVTKATANRLFYKCTSHSGMGNQGNILKNDLGNFGGNISGSSTSTGSFARVEAHGGLHIPTVGSQANGILFGDGDTGFYETADDDVYFKRGGNTVFRANTSSQLDIGVQHLFFNTTGGFFITTGAGSAAAPNYVFRGDQDTGMYRSADNVIGFSAGGALQLEIASNKISGSATSTGSFGKLAAGVSSPDGVSLEVQAHQDIARFKSTGDVNGNVFFDAASGRNANLTFTEAGTPLWYFGSNGGNNTLRAYAGVGDSEVFTLTQAGRLDIADEFHAAHIISTGVISGSAASTGSFGHIMVGGNNFTTAVSSSAAASGFGTGGGSSPNATDGSQTTISGSATSTGSFGRLETVGASNIGGILSIPGFPNVSSSLAAAVAGGDNLGNHTATQDINLDGNNLTNVSSLTATANISSSLSSTGSFGHLRLNGDDVPPIAVRGASILIGNGAGAVEDGSASRGNIFIGFEAGNDNTSGHSNVAIGDKAYDEGVATTDSNIAIGRDALGGSHAGLGADRTVAIGQGAAFGAINNVTGMVAVGYESLLAVTTGKRNTALGYQSGNTITDGEDNVIIGWDADGSGTGATNQIVIGRSVTGTGDNQTVIGNSSQTHVIFGGDALISGSAQSTGSFGVYSNNFIPSIDNTHDLGSSTHRWANAHIGDIELSNEGTEGNEVDGTTGSWTIQEGEDDLYLLNRKSGKKYKFKLEEIE